MSTNRNRPKDPMALLRKAGPAPAPEPDDTRAAARHLQGLLRRANGLGREPLVGVRYVPQTGRWVCIATTLDGADIRAGGVTAEAALREFSAKLEAHGR